MRIFFASCALITTLAAKPGDLDKSLHVGGGPDGIASAAVIDPAGKIVVGGSFKSFNGVPAGSIVRLLPDGKIDPEFKAAGGTQGEIKAIELLGNGKILVAGKFASFGGKDAMGIVMLAADGSVDPSFKSRLSAQEMSAGITCIESFPDGRIAVGGYFKAYGGKTAGRVAFLKPDGELDPAVTPQGGADSHIYDIDALPDGGVLVAGFFQSFGGHPTACVARFKADGGVDKSFQSTAPKSSVAYTVAGTPDGKVIAAGAFKTADGGKRSLARLTSAGGLDETFAANDAFPLNVYGVSIDPLGRILVAGQFIQYRDQQMLGLGRLKPDGSMDKDFDFVSAISPSFIQEYPIDSEGRVIAYGWRKHGGAAGPPPLYRVLGDDK